VEKQFKTINERNVKKEKIPKMEMKQMINNKYSDTQKGVLPHVRFNDYLREAQFSAKSITAKRDVFKNKDGYMNVGFN
jgi:deferrochelatase/peroxidase EfeB